ncbi:MAG: WecB/TagA/CpsF family glycosyltransferase [Veillonellales bacterium]
MKNRIAVLNTQINAVTMEEAVSLIEKFIQERVPHLVATANAEMVMLAEKDKELAEILKNADLIVPDGAGVVWAARHQGYIVPERVAGYDLVQYLLKRSAAKGYRVFLFGGSPGIADRARIVAEQYYKGVKILGTCNGFFDAKREQEIIQMIQSVQPDILLVALGVPKQEKWLARHMSQLNVPVSIGVGGTFDVMSGVMKRAPLWMQRANIEWLFRLISQPKRAMRMLALPHFVFKVLSIKKHGQK